VRTPSVVEFKPILAPPLGNGRHERNAIDVIVDGRSLSAANDGAPLDREAVQSMPQAAWFDNGTVVPMTCGCGDVGCADFRTEVRREGSLVTWTLWDSRRLVFEAEAAQRSLRAALSA